MANTLMELALTPQQGPDIAGSLGAGLEAGVGLAKAEQEIGAKKIQMQAAKDDLAQKQMNGLGNKLRFAAFAPKNFRKQALDQVESYASQANIPFDRVGFEAIMGDEQMGLKLQQGLSKIAKGELPVNPQEFLQLAGSSPELLQALQGDFAKAGASDLAFQREKELKQMDNEARLRAAQQEKQAKAEGSGEGFKQLDKDYAKDFNDFTGGGKTKAEDAIQKLEDFKAKLDKTSAGGGTIAGSLPDFMRREESIALRDNIVSVANSALKATFGGQLSDGERKALANEFYNDKLGNKANMEIMSRKIQELRNGLTAQQAKADYFKRGGTLRGYDPAMAEEVRYAAPTDKPNGSKQAGKSPAAVNPNTVAGRITEAASKGIPLATLEANMMSKFKRKMTEEEKNLYYDNAPAE